MSKQNWGLPFYPKYHIGQRVRNRHYEGDSSAIAAIKIEAKGISYRLNGCQYWLKESELCEKQEDE